MRGCIPTVVIAIQLDERINAAHKGMRAVHNRDFLMQRLDRVMEDTMSAIVQNAGDFHLCQFCMGFFRTVVCEPGDLYSLPELYFNFDAFAHRVAQHGLYGEIMCAPECNVCLG